MPLCSCGSVSVLKADLNKRGDVALSLKLYGTMDVLKYFRENRNLLEFLMERTLNLYPVWGENCKSLLNQINAIKFSVTSFEGNGVLRKC